MRAETLRWLADPCSELTEVIATSPNKEAPLPSYLQIAKIYGGARDPPSLTQAIA